MISLALKVLLECSEMSEYMETLLHSMWGKLLETLAESSQLQLSWSGPFISSWCWHLFFVFFFPCPVSTLPTEMSILIPLGYYTSPTLTHKCSYESGMTSQCISSHRLLAHRGLMKTSPGRMTKKKSSALPLGYWEGKSGAAYGHLAFHKNEAHWGELNHERKYYWYWDLRSNHVFM